jgi:crotonobetainyl-CoA:carnitine CoA-transferase CaiB-like acyl-CoA transferase
MSKPLSDIRVVDFTIVTAGAGATQVLADFGADVLKVEASGHFDPFRHWTALTGSVGGDEDISSAPFRVINRSKRALSINLESSEGQCALAEIIRKSDVLIENYRRGVIEKMGFSFEMLKAINPRLVMVSLSSQGASGPNRGYASFGSSLDALGGLMSITGYDAESPLWSGNKLNYPDQVVSLVAPGVVVAAVMEARRRNAAIWIDLSQRETVTSLMGEHVLAYGATSTLPVPEGNRSASSADFVVQTAGSDEWLAVSLASAADVCACASVIGRDDLAPTPLMRQQNGVYSVPEKLRNAVAVWAAGLTKQDAMAVLQSYGVAAAAVMKGPELLDNVDLRATGAFVSVPLPDGKGHEMQRGLPAHFVEAAWAISPVAAPHIGEHSAEILSELLRLPPGKIDDLIESGIIGVCNATTNA